MVHTISLVGWQKLVLLLDLFKDSRAHHSGELISQQARFGVLASSAS